MAKRVYFGFHYEDVKSFRANVVRNHNVVRSETDEIVYFDASIWEEAKKQGELALKRLINKELERTTVTCVLIGSETYERPWVQYEIFKSIQRKSKIVGIHINNIKGKDEKTKSLGPNPFDYLGFVVTQDGHALAPCVWQTGIWRRFGLLDGWRLDEPRPSNERDTILQLSKYIKVYDWVTDNGYENFGRWIA